MQIVLTSSLVGQERLLRGCKIKGNSAQKEGVSCMAVPGRRISGDKIRLLDRFRQVDKAAQRKLIKFVWSGLLIVVIGLVMIVVGLDLNTGAYSAEGLLIGFGAIAVIVGIIRLLIGFIRPLSPTDLDTMEIIEEEKQVEPDLDAQLFEE
jgi:hypothetical protein